MSDADRSTKVTHRARELANQYATKKTPEVVRLIVDFISARDSFTSGNLEFEDLIGKHLALAYALGYVDGDKGEIARKMYV